MDDDEEEGDNTSLNGDHKKDIQHCQILHYNLLHILAEQNESLEEDEVAVADIHSSNEEVVLVVVEEVVDMYKDPRMERKQFVLFYHETVELVNVLDTRNWVVVAVVVHYHFSFSFLWSHHFLKAEPLRCFQRILLMVLLLLLRWWWWLVVVVGVVVVVVVA
jgi:hypothetical protein